MEFMKDIRFLFDLINPGEFPKIINERNKILESSDRKGGRTPYIREQSARETVHTLKDLGKGN
jgi:hypothetical protein